MNNCVIRVLLGGGKVIAGVEGARGILWPIVNKRYCELCQRHNGIGTSDDSDVETLLDIVEGRKSVETRCGWLSCVMHDNCHGNL